MGVIVRRPRLGVSEVVKSQRDLALVYAALALVEGTPMQRVGKPEEVASVVLWLCSEQSSFVTGSVIPIDGGQFAGLKPPRTYRPGEGMKPAS